MRFEKPKDETLPLASDPNATCQKCRAAMVEIERCIRCRRAPDQCYCRPAEFEGKMVCPSCGGK